MRACKPRSVWGWLLLVTVASLLGIALGQPQPKVYKPHKRAKQGPQGQVVPDTPTQQDIPNGFAAPPVLRIPGAFTDDDDEEVKAPELPLRPFTAKKRNPTHAYVRSASSLRALASLSDLDALLDLSTEHATKGAKSVASDDALSPLRRFLVPRAAGSQNLSDVQAMVARHFERLGWHVELDTFTSETPLGERKFTNVIATHDLEAKRRLVLSAHTDSKHFDTYPESSFVGATDSAAPCVMLLDIAQSLSALLDERRAKVKEQGGEQGEPGQLETLQFVFFDGEEAFKLWTKDDSIYGARWASALLRSAHTSH